MKLLAATDTGWSPATDPNNHVLSGELLMPAEQCDKPHCYCRREFISVTTYCRTMHAQVVDLEITDEQLEDIARAYITELYPDDPLEDDDVNDLVHAMISPGPDFPVGTVIERWGYELRDIRDNTLSDDDD
jgi:hypothetical protein